MRPHTLGAPVLAAVLAAVLAPTGAHAARRDFSQVRDARTEASGRFELLLWNHVNNCCRRDSDYNLEVAGLGLAYGISRRLEVSLALVYHWGYADEPYLPFGGQGYGVEGVSLVRLGARLRLVDPGRWPVSLLLQASLGASTDIVTALVLGQRLVLESPLGPVDLVVNAAAREVVAHRDGGVVVAIDAGLRYRVSSTVRIGFEGGYGTSVPTAAPWLDIEGGARPFPYLGPSVSIGTDRLWVELFAGLSGLFGGALHIAIGATL